MRGIFLLKLIHARMFVSIIANDSVATPIFWRKIEISSIYRPLVF